jgi:transcriptional regulator with XRE-family HTH domain
VTLGRFLKTAREAAGVSIEDAAVAGGWKHPNSVLHIESGQRGIAIDHLTKLLIAYRIPAEQWPAVMLMPLQDGPVPTAAPTEAV